MVYADSVGQDERQRTVVTSYTPHTHTHTTCFNTYAIYETPIKYLCFLTLFYVNWC